MPGKTDTSSTSPDTSRFATTHWSMVLAAGSPESPRYREALETLCRAYWFPLYVYLRRRGYDVHQAEEHTQAFFANLLEKRGLRLVDPKLGRFRSFLLAALKHFLADEHGRANAQKRGGGRKVLSLDFRRAESQYMLEPADRLSPEKHFEKSWALNVLDRTMSRLKAESITADKARLFDRLKLCLTGAEDADSYGKVAIDLDMTAGAVRTAVHRLRKRYGQVLRDEIAQTVNTKEDVEQEIQDLFVALAY